MPLPRLSLEQLDCLYLAGTDVLCAVEELAGYVVVEETALSTNTLVDSESLVSVDFSSPSKPEPEQETDDAFSFNPSAFFASFREVHIGGPTFDDIIGEADH